MSQNNGLWPPCFISNAYHISLSTMDLLTIMGMATMASIGTAGVPSISLITLVWYLSM